MRGELRAWSLPAKAVAPLGAGAAGRNLRWAVAAALLIACGFALARLTSPRGTDVAHLRQELARQVSAEVRRELAAELAKHDAEQASRQDEFQRAVVQAVSQLEVRRVADQARLREDVETVALKTREQFERLASDRGDLDDATNH